MISQLKSSGVVKYATFHYRAFYLSDQIDTAKYREVNPLNLIASSVRELYYGWNDNKYCFLLSYGAIVYLNFSDQEIEAHFDGIKPYCRNFFARELEDDFKVQINDQRSFEIKFDTLTIPRFDHDVNRVIMLNLAETVTLDYYHRTSQELLAQIKSYTGVLEKSGKIEMSRKNTLRFMGRALGVKNSLAENLYILNLPDLAWEDEFLDKIHKGLSRHFELMQRYNTIDNTIKIINDSLSIYISHNHHKESSRLEWIIIILILVEVIDTFLMKFL